jgi:hypothetical protein
MSTPLYDAWSTRANQTVAFDDVLVGRLRFCTVCGRPSTQREGVWLGGPPWGVAPFGSSRLL